MPRNNNPCRRVVPSQQTHVFGTNDSWPSVAAGQRAGYTPRRCLSSSVACPASARRPSPESSRERLARYTCGSTLSNRLCAGQAIAWRVRDTKSHTPWRRTTSVRAGRSLPTVLIHGRSRAARGAPWRNALAWPRSTSRSSAPTRPNTEAASNRASRTSRATRFPPGGTLSSATTTHGTAIGSW